MAGNPDNDQIGRVPRETPQRALSDETPPVHVEISPEDAVAEARSEVEQANARAAAAEREAREAREARQVAETRVTEASGAALTAQERQIESAIIAEKTRLEHAKTAYATAFNAADGAAAAQAQVEIADAAAALRQHNQNKEWLAAEKARAAEEAKRAATVQSTRGGGVEIATPAGRITVSPQDKQWMDAHPRFYSDNRYYNAAIAAHATLVEDGVNPGSNAYYRGLDEAMKDYEDFDAHRRGEQQPVNDGMSQRQQMRRQPSAASVGAPVSRASAPRTNNGQPTVRDIASRFPGVTEQDLREFARINGYTKNKGYKSDDDAFQAYLNDQAEIAAIERAGGDTGLEVDRNYR